MQKYWCTGVQSCMQLQGLVGAAIIRSKTVSMAKQATIFSQTTFSNYYWKQRVNIRIRFKLFLELTHSHSPVLSKGKATDLLSCLALQTSYMGVYIHYDTTI